MQKAIPYSPLQLTPLMNHSFDPRLVSAQEENQTLAALLRLWLPYLSWSQARKLIEQRRVLVDGELCLDQARRLKEGEKVEVLTSPVPKAPGSTTDELVIRYVDEHIVVVEKPSGMNTVRHPAERQWPRRRREQNPTLEDLTTFALGKREHVRSARLRIVHRLDKATSGLVVFARTVLAERELGKQFSAHTVNRLYWAVIPGYLPPQTIESWLVRDRGDGRRGSTTQAGVGKRAVTHIEVVERLNNYTLLSCRLETGRTHQIRIHLAEAGHPVCGEKVYQHTPDESGAPRLALHAVELGFDHPTTHESLHWRMELPEDLAKWLERLRSEGTRGGRHPL